MKVSEIMTRRVVTVSMDDSLQYINSIFEQTGFHHVLVVQRDVVVGVISDRDVLKHLSPFIGKLSELKRDMSTLKKRAHQIMTRKPITIRPENTLSEAAEVLIREGVSCLPVVDAEGLLKGILTSKDLLKYVVRK